MGTGEATPSSPIGDGAAGGTEASNRRYGADRRARPTRFVDSLLGWHRRADGRRDGETEDVYVDVYDRNDLLLLLAILTLNVLDAFFTLRWLQMGGREANPLMDWLIEVGNEAFLIQKCIVVGLWLIVLVVHKNFRVARIGLWSLLALYSGLLVYHIYLQTG